MGGKIQASVRIFVWKPPPAQLARVEGTKVEVHFGHPRDGRYGLHWWMDVGKNGDVYGGPPRLQHGVNIGRELFRLSHHQTGQRHYHGSNGRTLLEPTAPLSKLPGRTLIGAWGHAGLLDFSKTPQPDSATRRTSMLNFRPTHVVLWTVEPGRDDLIGEIQRVNPLRPQFIYVDWTTPHYLIELYTNSPVDPGGIDTGGFWLLPSEDGGVRVVDQDDPSVSDPASFSTE